MTTIDVRFFAGAAEAFGTDRLSLTLGDQATLGAALHALTHGAAPGATDDAPTVLGRCSFLVDRVSASDPATPLADGARVDVMPPFAGG
ncbi:MAG: MoaD/ThiS family protein [Dermabacter sp.]|nr:MoaD/ThiS family protein [Dermabacter sp.]